jgi:hypothetical protein
MVDLIFGPVCLVIGIWLALWFVWEVIKYLFKKLINRLLGTVGPTP